MSKLATTLALSASKRIVRLETEAKARDETIDRLRGLLREFYTYGVGLVGTKFGMPYCPICKCAAKGILHTEGCLAVRAYAALAEKP